MSDEYLNELLARTNSKADKAEDTERVNLLNPQGEYEAACHPSNKGLTRLHVMKVGQDAVTFQYVHMRSHSTGGNGGFTIEFDDGNRWRVTVRGRNLWEIYDYCTLHRMPCIRELGPERDFPDQFPRDKPVITEIRIEEVKEDQS